VHIDNRCVTGSGEPQIRRAAGPNDYVLTGTCAKRTELASKPIDDPGYFTADAFKTYLASKGITIDGTIQAAPADAKPKVIATQSTRLADILRRLNKSSQNFMAEALDKLSGERLRQSQPNAAHGTSWEAGAQAARLFLTSHGVDATALVTADGSGLSRDNRVTARMLTDLLAGMDAHPSAAVFRDSLPVGGVDGTLRRRFTDVKGRVLAKTGSIGGVRSLSGYTTFADGRRVAFSILSNDIKGDEDAWLKQMDAAVRAMIQ
jgi:D-alanyl-D-alanine carboxypeptidase/D-alanyl-D-alanine-endopeptidase (penicillin-binding protein 4)